MSNLTCPACGRALRLIPAGPDAPARCWTCGVPVAVDGATVTVFPESPDAATATHAPTPETDATRPPDEQAPTRPGSEDPDTLPHVPDQNRPAGSQPGRRWPTIPGYEIEAELGRGGMGVVYKARQLNPRRQVALKMILGGGHAGRFRSEIAAVARLGHPNIVRIHEVGEVSGRPFYSMEYVAGGTLAARLARSAGGSADRTGQGTGRSAGGSADRTGREQGRSLAPGEAARLVARLARAVQHAHDKGIVHRDLKPGNVLLAPGEASPADESGAGLDRCVPKIADFGLAKHLDGGDGVHTQSGAVLGTPSYMSPEQARGRVKEIGPATDVYALGAILYECLTGRPPFREDAAVDTLMKVVTEDPPPPRRLRADLPRDLETVCLKCLRKEPGKRYATAGELASDLERFVNGEPITARARTVRERVGGWARRRREILFLAAGIALAAGLALALASGSRKNPAPAADPQDLPPEVAALPPDLRLVPADSFAFLTVRVADQWANPALGELFDHARQFGSAPTLGEIAQAVEESTSLRPENIERMTIALSQPRHRGLPLLVLSTAQPYSHDRLHALLTGRGRYEVQEVGGRRVYIPADRGVFAFFLATDRVLVLGDPELVSKAATAPPTAGPLTPALGRAAGSHTVVLAANPPPDAVAQAFLNLRLDPVADPVARLRIVGLTADVGRAPDPDGRDSVELNGWADFPDEASAEAALPNAPVTHRILMVFSDLLAVPSGIVDLARPHLIPIEQTQWTRDRSTLHASVRTEVSVAGVKEQITQLTAGRRSADNLRRIASAMRQYHDKHGRFPPAVVTDPDGKPLYSWRVLLLPYLGGETVYRRFHLNRAWDHPSNRPLLDNMPAAFAAPGAPRGTTTTPYQVLTGPGGLFDSPDGRRLADIGDGPAHTLLLVESQTAVHWSEPADVAVEEGRLPKLGGVVGSGFYAATAEGIVLHLRHDSITPDRFRGLFTRAGGEVVKLP